MTMTRLAATRMSRAPRPPRTRPLAVDARRRLARRAAHATPHATVDGEGARVAREGARSAPRVAHGARRRAVVARRVGHRTRAWLSTERAGCTAAPSRVRCASASSAKASVTPVARGAKTCDLSCKTPPGTNRRRIRTNRANAAFVAISSRRNAWPLHKLVWKSGFVF